MNQTNVQPPSLPERPDEPAWKQCGDLQQLIAKWRANAHELRTSQFPRRGTTIGTLVQCADELDALLHAPSVAERQGQEASPWMPISSAPVGRKVQLLTSHGAVLLDDWGLYSKYNVPQFVMWAEPIPPPGVDTDHQDLRSGEAVDARQVEK